MATGERSPSPNSATFLKLELQERIVRPNGRSVRVRSMSAYWGCQMGPAQLFALPMGVASVFTKEKRFRGNPILSSRRLNERGLHRWRVRWAHAASARRRAALAGLLDEGERAALDRDGFVVRENALPQSIFERLVEELETIRRPAWEMREGHAITRVMPLPAIDDGSAAAEARRFLRTRQMRGLVGYAAGRAGGYNPIIQTIANNPDPNRPDPQNTLHADTFHPTAKFWLFMHDIAPDEGPFSYVAGSHRLTPERLAFEYAQSLMAADGESAHHASGSFRASEADMEALGYGALTTLPVRGNTLVVADTYGFHRRTPTAKPTVRTELYAMLRRNPFVPWNGGDLSEVPLLHERMLTTRLAYRDWKARRGRYSKYRNVGLRFAADPVE